VVPVLVDGVVLREGFGVVVCKGVIVLKRVAMGEISWRRVIMTGRVRLRSGE